MLFHIFFMISGIQEMIEAVGYLAILVDSEIPSCDKIIEKLHLQDHFSPETFQIEYVLGLSDIAGKALAFLNETTTKELFFCRRSHEIRYKYGCQRRFEPGIQVQKVFARLLRRLPVGEHVGQQRNPEKSRCFEDEHVEGTESQYPKLNKICSNCFPIFRLRRSATRVSSSRLKLNLSNQTKRPLWHKRTQHQNCDQEWYKRILRIYIEHKCFPN